MSYCRWLSSDWYIYWDCNSDDSKGRDGQLLAIWNRKDPNCAESMHYYPRIKNDRDGIWNEIKQRIKPHRMLYRDKFDISLDDFIEEVENSFEEQL